MILVEGWDAEPEALNVDVAACVVCGEYCTKTEMLGWVVWGEPGDWVQSPVLAYHRGRCARVLERAARPDGMLLDGHVGDRMRYLQHNVEFPPIAGVGGLIKRHRQKIDLIATHFLLVSIDSPLVW